jgi:hypothetical protein
MAGVPPVSLRGIRIQSVRYNIGATLSDIIHSSYSQSTIFPSKPWRTELRLVE